jgi:hypothetical protein
MRVPTSVALAASLSLAVATPGLALTVVQPPLGSDSQAFHHDDDGAALDNMVGHVHETVENALRSQGGGAFTGGDGPRTPYGYTSQTSNFGPVSSTTSTYRDDLGAAAPPVYSAPLLITPAHRP